MKKTERRRPRLHDVFFFPPSCHDPLSATWQNKRIRVREETLREGELRSGGEADHRQGWVERVVCSRAGDQTGNKRGAGHDVLSRVEECGGTPQRQGGGKVSGVEWSGVEWSGARTHL